MVDIAEIITIDEKKEKKREYDKIRYATPEYKERHRKQDRERRKRLKEAGTPVPSGSPNNKWDNGYFVGFDTEGADIPEGDRTKHQLIHMQYVTERGDEDAISSITGLTFKEIIEWLFNASKSHPKGVFVVFGGQYDFQMILKRMLSSFSLVQRFWKSTVNGGWFTRELTNMMRVIIRYVPRKQLIICRQMRVYDQTGNNVKKNWKTTDTINIWDVWGFFQGAFLPNVKDYLGMDERYTLIEEGKKRRSEFNPTELPFIIKYCKAECAALVDMMVLFKSYVKQIDVKLRRWDGAGALAAAIFDRFDIRRHMKESPKDVHQAACYAMCGGRSELFLAGWHNDKTYRYDLNSAYPAHMKELPNLTKGIWKKGDVTQWQNYTDKFALFHIHWNFRDYKTQPLQMFPFPVRQNKGSGMVIYPAWGMNWIWSPEMRMYDKHKEAYGQHDFCVEEIWYFDEEDASDRPMLFVEALYRQRQEWKKQGIKAEIALKLGLNSLYGKMAQNVGGHDDKAPPYFQVEWAGWITSATRADIYDAGMHSPDNIIMMATDGIYSTTPLDLPLSSIKELGKWEDKTYDASLFVQAGVYWCFEDGKEVEARHRGYSTDYADSELALTTQRIIEAWEQNKQSIEVASRRTFTTIGLAAQSVNTYEYMCEWVGNNKELDLYNISAKRVVLNQTPTFHLGLEKTYAMSKWLRTQQLGIYQWERNLTHEQRMEARIEHWKPSHSRPYIPQFATPDNPLYCDLFNTGLTIDKEQIQKMRERRMLIEEGASI